MKTWKHADVVLLTFIQFFCNSRMYSTKLATKLPAVLVKAVAINVQTFTLSK